MKRCIEVFHLSYFKENSGTPVSWVEAWSSREGGCPVLPTRCLLGEGPHPDILSSYVYALLHLPASAPRRSVSLSFPTVS